MALQHKEGKYLSTGSLSILPEYFQLVSVHKQYGSLSLQLYTETQETVWATINTDKNN